jgi:hypothetical protein
VDVVVVGVVVGAASVPVRCCRELHVHQRLVAEVLCFAVEFGRPMRGIGLALRHQVPVAEAVVLVWNVFLNRLVELVQLGSHVVGYSSRHMGVENMAALGCSSWLAVGHELVVGSPILDFGDHLQLVGIVDDEFARLSFVGGCSTGNDFALGGNGRYFVVVLLYGGQVSRVSWKVDRRLGQVRVAAKLASSPRGL